MRLQFLIEGIEGHSPKDYGKIVLPPEMIIRKFSLKHKLELEQLDK
jgi:hypothetical protein